MIIVWNRLEGSWYHSHKGRTITFGGEKHKIPFKETFSSKDEIPFDLNLNGNHAGPLVGILCGRKANSEIFGNGQLIRKLQQHLLPIGGLCFVFAAEDVYDSFIEGYIYLPFQNSWIKVVTPFPDVVYNRVPLRIIEKTPVCESLFQELKKRKIPFFNPCFIDKYQLFVLLKAHPILRDFLPDSELVTHLDDLSRFINQHKAIYLKPCLSSKGKGIYRLELSSKNQVHFKSLNKEIWYENIHVCWEAISEQLTHKKYLMQEAILPFSFNKHRFDFRILVHARVGNYVVSGVGVRQAPIRNLTTHIPNGGTCLPYKEIQTKAHDHFIKTAAEQIGQLLTEKFGFFGEFSIDAGISTDEQYYIFEVNSKPMSFDEKEIEQNKIHQLCLLFYDLTGFTYSS